MTTLRALQVGPIARISLGVIALLVSLALLTDMLLGVIPSHGDEQRRLRKRTAETLAVQITALLEAGDTRTLRKTIEQVTARDPDIVSVTVQRDDGSLIVRHTRAAYDDSAAPERMRVPVFSGRQPWGDIDVGFTRAGPTTLWAWLQQPSVQMLLLFSTCGFALCYAYLRRAIQYLNPSASVPDRVRKAFDSLTEGLVIVDQQARIVLANRAFRRLHPQAAIELNGQRIDTLDWLVQAWRETAAPWTQTLQSSSPVSAEPLAVAQPGGPPTRLLVSSAPITDNRGRTRGCLVTFDDVTAMHRAHEELRETMAELERSHQRIEEQNEELRRLASRDPLTGCYNRRAFFEMASNTFDKASRENASLCCLMVDIDHFKRFNDLYGHAVGDQVIQVAARLLSSLLRQADILCRYGGEEFCIVLPGTTLQTAQSAAERMRVHIEQHANESLRGMDITPITASIGLACVSQGAASLEALIDQADQALYASKQNGRNRVTVWENAGGS